MFFVSSRGNFIRLKEIQLQKNKISSSERLEAKTKLGEKSGNKCKSLKAARLFPSRSTIARALATKAPRTFKFDIDKSIKNLLTEKRKLIIRLR